MNRFLSILLVFSLFAAGCVPGFEKEEEVIQDPGEQETMEKAIVPRYKISDDYYQTILPFKAGQTRGQVVARLNSRVDVAELETGLMRLAQGPFSSDKFLYQEGQYIDRDTIRSWLARELTPEQLEEKKKEEKDEDYPNIGLNPPFIQGETTEKTNENSPIYLAHILEQNYLVHKDDGTVELGGISIGVALNSVHYYNLEASAGGFPREYNIDDEELEQAGREIAEKIVQRVRGMDGLSNVPIVIGLFKQSPATSIVPGNFIAKAEISSGDTSLNWDALNEEYHLFPSTDASEAYRDDAVRFDRFKLAIDDYFPNHTGIIAKGYYRDEDLQQLTIEVNMDFYGKAELIGFTQYVTGLVMEHYPNYINLQLSISSINGQEALIVRDAGAEKPFVHIY
ncbi:CamS family sex pheromone protein [Sutcliffiella halmapala]|uniref:CamS family sex pheromone protein n=1 Tax=Sutcliffiella halmapala TaxID=79882 RepID=UPI001F3DC084|nr:CamS family sex pheromone protein [Sutcliffiella halmapala]